MKQKLLAAILALLTAFSSLIYSQSGPIPFIKNNGTFTYFVGKTEPPTEWMNNSFNDSEWQYADTAIIGYGWPKQPRRNKSLDSLVIEKATSLYIRINFDIDNPSRFRDLNFEADYNDAFIAYLNGEEIARKNIGKPGEYAAYNQLADRAHKQTTYRNYYGAVNGIYIDSVTVKKLLKQGKNVFAVHVLNDSIDGSDLSFKANVYNIKECDPYYYYSQSWVKYYQQIPLVLSKYPIVFVNTDAYGIPLIADNPKLNISKKVVAQMSIIDKKGQLNKIDDPIDFTGRISLARRGQTSKDFPKMCFTIETQDSNGENLDTAIMGMPSDNDWILNSFYGDKTLIRNELTYYIGRRLGHYEPRTQFCELVLNGEYQGLYTFMETIKRDKHRVSVAKRDSINPSDGGYVFKYDKDSPGVIQYVSPKESDMTSVEKDYLANFQKSFTQAILGPNFMDPESGYAKYISGKSLIDNVLINELTKNCDAYLFSTYFHKDKDSKDGRLKYGPLWDFDLAYCGAPWQNGDRTYGWQFAEPTSNYLYVPKLFRDTVLTHAYARRWTSLRKNFLADDELFGIIDSLANNIYDSRLKNYEVWPIIDKPYIWPVVATYTYDDDINLIKNWLTERMKWIDENINSIYYPLNTDVPSLANNNVSIDVYPNPFVDHFIVKIIAERGTYQSVIQGLDGKTFSSKQLICNENEIINLQYTSNDLNNLKNGIFFVMIVKNGQVVQAKKIIKATAR